MITASHLTKRYGAKTAVDDVSFTVQPGRVTGFLGPNGAGKSTTMRMILGLDTPSAGSVTVDGVAYRTLPSPITSVGALLDAKAMHPARTARNNLRALAATHGLPASRVDAVIRMAGIESVANKRPKGFSLGMGQRLGIAAALLGDPHTLILDEPVNGLDPEGVLWVRRLVRRLAAEGRTVLLSSHLMSEMAQTADQIIVIGQGRILADSPIEELVSSWTTRSVVVSSTRLAELLPRLSAPEVTVSSDVPGTATITGVSAERIAAIAAEHGIPLHQLTDISGSLEDAYLALTEGSVDYASKELA